LRARGEEEHRRRAQKKSTEEEHRRRAQKKSTEEEHAIKPIDEGEADAEINKHRRDLSKDSKKHNLGASENRKFTEGSEREEICEDDER
jgi:hypothetical protein